MYVKKGDINMNENKGMKIELDEKERQFILGAIDLAITAEHIREENLEWILKLENRLKNKESE